MVSSLSDAQQTALAEEAKRLHRRYSEAFVEAFHLCPWAKRAREEGATGCEVVLAFDGVEAPAVHDAVQRLEANAKIEVGFVLLPGFDIERTAFERWTSTRREENARDHGGSPPMAWAPFHPDAPACFESAARLVPFIRRSADPTLQLIRRSALESVRKPSDSGTGFVDPATMSPAAIAALLAGKASAPLHERVGDANFRTLKQKQKQAESVLSALHAEREARYASIVG